MSTLKAETVLSLIGQLPPMEQARLRQLLAESPGGLPHPTTHAGNPRPPLDKRLPNQPAHDFSREMGWLAEHRREYANQWIALEGDRLIAASPDHETVFAALDTAVIKLPFVTFIEDPDRPIQIVWQ